MSREKLNEELFDVFLAEALRQVEEEELQKSGQFFEEHKMEDYVPSKCFVRRINGLIDALYPARLEQQRTAAGSECFVDCGNCIRKFDFFSKCKWIFPL